MATVQSSSGGNMKRYLFLDDQNKVVHLVEGNHSQELMDAFLRDFSIMFNAVGYEEVDLPNDVWIDWTFDGTSFIKPEVE